MKNNKYFLFLASWCLSGFALLLGLAGAAIAADPVVIEIRHMNFTPQTVTIPKGTRVVWLNRDEAPHNVAIAGRFKSPILSTDESFEQSFDDAGSFAYTCPVHVGMAGMITVTND